jgi:hypothetical protein
MGASPDDVLRLYVSSQAPPSADPRCRDVVNRRLKDLLAGSVEWDEFPATSRCWRLFEGAANLDEITFPTRGFSGLTLRVYDPERKEWSLYWVNSHNGLLQPPVVGGFAYSHGDFYGDDVHECRAIRVHYIWSRITPTSARWEQSFSIDHEQTWETNWIMNLTRRDPRQA